MVHLSLLRKRTLPIWLTSLAVLVAGCGGGQDPILGETGNAQAAPRVTSVTPAINALNVPIATKAITASFTKPMNAATIAAASFKLECPAGFAVSGLVSYNASNMSATLALPATTVLPPSSLCKATVSKSVQDTWGIPLDSDFAWSFTTGTSPDTTAPTVTSTINANGATNVAFNAKVGATFSEAMNPASITATTFRMSESTSGSTVAGSVQYLGVSAIFTPTVALTPATRYTVTIKGGVGNASDLAGNVMVNDYVYSWTTGTSADATAPIVTGTINANGATNVAFNTKAGATFSEGMDPLTVTTANFVLTNGATPISGTLSYSGVNAIFTPLLNLSPSTLYTITIKGGVGGVADLAGNVMVSDYVYSWTTGTAAESGAPVVTGTINANGAINVGLNTKVGVAFSEGMDPFTLTIENFSVMNGITPVSGIVSYSGVSAIFTPVVYLSPLRLYTVTIKGGARGVADLAGNVMVSDYVYSWTTGAALDTVAPSVSGTINANGATNVAFNTKVGATFTEGMDALSVTTANFTLKNGTTPVTGTLSYSGVSAIFTPLVNLLPSTLYTVTIKGGLGGVADLAGNFMVSDYVYSWTTSSNPDSTAPIVTGTINANSATNVAFNAKAGATFSEGMDPLTVTTTNFVVKSGAIPVAGTLSFSGVNAIFTPLVNLSPSTLYTVTIKGGVGGVADLAGNVMVNDFLISWTTGMATDVIAPLVTGSINTNGATNVAINAKAGATFNEGMDPLTLTTANFSLKNGNNPVMGTLSYSGVNAIFTPLVSLSPSTVYTVTIKGGVGGVADLAGNVMLNDFVNSWTTGATPDTTAPSVTGTINVNGAVNVAFNAKAGATFSEGMDPLTLTTANFLVKNGAAPVAGTLNYSGVHAIFTPLVNLLPSTLYTVTVKGGAGGVADLAGNAMASDFVNSWTTGATPDTTAPLVSVVSPTDGATNVPVASSVTATFSEAMDPLSLNTASFSVAGVLGTMVFDGVNRTATFKPNSDLAKATQYTATITTAAKDLAGNGLVANRVWSFTTESAVVVNLPPAIPLGTASTFGTFGGSAGMTNTGILSIINGNIGTIATGTSSITGFHDNFGDIYTETPSNIGSVTGKIYACTNSTTGPNSTGPNAPACAIATQARLDAQSAYLALVAKPPLGGSPAPGANMAGVTLLPGVYTAPGGSYLIQGGNLTLDAQGDPNATWIFQMAGTLTVGGPGAAFPQSIILAGGAQAKNVFWQVGSFATINAGGGGTMVGTIISQTGAAFSTAGNTNPVTLLGRVLSLGASVTLVNTIITVPSL